MHGQHHEDIAELKQCTRHLKSEVAVQDERTQTILKRLDEGRKDFRAIRSDIEDINVSLGRLAEQVQAN
jgi:uncharacterized coiled-coil DUF342 family protein